MYRDSKYYGENSFAYASEMTMDNRDKAEEATANFWVCGQFFVTGRARDQTFAYDIFFFVT